MKKSPSSPGLKPLKGKNVAPKQLPPKVINKSPSQFVYNAPKKGMKMLEKGMKKLSTRYKK